MAQDSLEQHRRAQSEFTRLAESFESAAVLADDELMFCVNASNVLICTFHNGDRHR